MKLHLIISVLALAVSLGAGAYLTDFAAYLGDDPATCNRCHVMDAAYEGWYHGGHRPWATCNDCHTPHSPILKYLYKGYVGTRDVILFTFDWYPLAARAEPLSQAIIQENCLRCHGETVSMVGDGQPDAGRNCVSCHRSVAHGARGISLAP